MRFEGTHYRISFLEGFVERSEGVLHSNILVWHFLDVHVELGKLKPAWATSPRLSDLLGVLL